MKTLVTQSDIEGGPDISDSNNTKTIIIIAVIAIIIIVAGALIWHYTQKKK